MAKTNALTESFAAGEISPLLTGQVSGEGYKQGVSYLLNTLTDPRGPLFRRPGFEKRGSISDRTQARKVAFNSTGGTRFDLIVTDSLITITPEEAQRYGANTVPNGKFVLKDTTWEDSSHANASVVITKGLAKLTPGIVAGEDATIECVLPISVLSTNHKFELFGIFPGQSAPEGLSISVGTTKGGTDILNITASGDIKYRLVSTVAVGANTKLYMTLKANPQTSLGDVADVLTNYITAVCLKPVIATPITETVVAPYTDAEVKDIHAVIAPDGKNMYFCHSNYTPYKLNYNPGTGAWTFLAVPFLNPPAEWTGTSYPATMGFYQGRGYWAGTVDNPESFWASVSGNPEDITIGILAADAFKYTIAENGLIKWIIGYKNLLIGTANGEHVASSESGLLTVVDIQVDQQSAFGSGSVQPIKIGTEILYVSPDGLKLRTMGYSWTDSGWVSQDLTEASEHITADRITSLSFARNPDSIIWMATESGGLISCAYRHLGGTTPIIGWHRHEVEGAILDTSVLEDDGTSYLWVAIRRTLGNTPEITWERAFNKADNLFTDGSVVLKAITATDTITGLDHLDGMYVKALVDGAAHPDVLVAGGSAVLDVTGYVIIVGTHTNPVITTLPLVEYGTSSPVIFGKKRWAGVNILIQESAIPLINDTRPPDRNPSTPMGIVEPLTSGLIEVPQLGWDSYGVVTIEQDLPLPLILVALTGETKHNRL